MHAPTIIKKATKSICNTMMTVFIIGKETSLVLPAVQHVVSARDKNGCSTCDNVSAWALHWPAPSKFGAIIRTKKL